MSTPYFDLGSDFFQNFPPLGSENYSAVSEKFDGFSATTSSGAVYYDLVTRTYPICSGYAILGFPFFDGFIQSQILSLIGAGRAESNPRPSVYKTAALPLSYTGNHSIYHLLDTNERPISMVRHHGPQLL